MKNLYNHIKKIGLSKANDSRPIQKNMLYMDGYAYVTDSYRALRIHQEKATEKPFLINLETMQYSKVGIYPTELANFFDKHDKTTVIEYSKILEMLELSKLAKNLDQYVMLLLPDDQKVFFKAEIVVQMLQFFKDAQTSITVGYVLDDTNVKQPVIFSDLYKEYNYILAPVRNYNDADKAVRIDLTK